MEDTRVFLFVGAIRAYKGLSDLTDAFRHIHRPDVRVLIAGKPATDADTQLLAAAAAGDPRIELRLGFVPDEDLAVLLGAADAVVLPFRDILTSGSAILAMSYGRAVVAPSLGCLPETLDPQASILYDPLSPDALANALESALSADLDAMGEHALVLARRLAWGPIALATAELYRA
jgi:glycosyltransferase involved in cell wall biosynthesis